MDLENLSAGTPATPGSASEPSHRHPSAASAAAGPSPAAARCPQPRPLGQAEHARVLRWQDACDHRRHARGQRAAGRAAHATLRNLGPVHDRRAWGVRREVRYFWIVRDIELAPGTVLRSGQVIPPTGATLRGAPLGTYLHSRGQARKALARAQRTHPDAYLVCWVSLHSNGQIARPSCLVYPDATAGRANVRTEAR